MTDAVGFEYAYDPKTDQFAHGTALPCSRRRAIVALLLRLRVQAPRTASRPRRGSAGTHRHATDQLLLLCYHYDPATGKYSRSAMNHSSRAGGIATVMIGARTVSSSSVAESRNRDPPTGTTAMMLADFPLFPEQASTCRRQVGQAVHMLCILAGACLRPDRLC